MKRTLLIAAPLLVLLTAALLLFTAREDIGPLMGRLLAMEGKLFLEQPPPLRKIPHVFDVGVVDADGDGRLDLFTSNHNYKQVLMLNNGHGGHQDVLTRWGLDQNREFPGWEQSFTAPVMNRPGLYIYWLGDVLTLRAKGLSGIGPVAGTLKMFSKITVKHNHGFTLKISKASVPDSPIEESIVDFQGDGDGLLELIPPSRGVPTHIEVVSGFPLDSVFIGNQKATPLSRSFSPYLRDRHGHAWADINGDGQIDVYISRGGVGGMIRKLPASVRQRIADELLVTGGSQRFTDVTAERGIEKKDCSGRHAEWVDYDGDGRLDLFVNCQDRGKSQGIFPKQLWRQLADGRFEDVALDVGLGLPEKELIDFVWMDADGDGDVDLLTSEDQGFFLYRNEGAQFTPEFLFRPDFVRADVSGLKGEVNNYWRFDGKLTVADFDADGDLDVFSSSKRGNVLLLNDSGIFRRVDPVSLGLPTRSLNAVWVDFDNDGHQDLHVVPDGLYRQNPQGRFEATGLLALTHDLYQAAIVHWYDQDNDGKRDALLVLNENPSLWRWWQKPFRKGDDAHMWVVHSYRNIGSGNHWLQIQMRGPTGNSQAIGAHVSVTTPLGEQAQVVGGSDSSFFSQGHYRLYFGLGPHARVLRITVRWNDGYTQEFKDVAADQLLTIEYQGSRKETVSP